MTRSHSAPAPAARSSSASYIVSSGSRSSGDCSAYSGITPPDGATSSRRATFAAHARTTPSTTTIEAAARPKHSRLSARARRSSAGCATASASMTRTSEFFLARQLFDLPHLRLAGLDVLRGVAELDDRLERGDAALEVGLRFQERAEPAIAREERRAPAADDRAAHVGVADERRVAPRDGVAALHRRVERGERAVH